MRVAYISSAAYSDVDLSYISELQRFVDVTYYVLVHPGNLQSCALNFKNDNLKEGLNKGGGLLGLKCYSDIINLDKVFVLYSGKHKGYSLTSIKASYSFNKHLKREKYDVIHLTTAPTLYNPFYYTGLRKKIVLTVHDPIPHSSASLKGTELSRKIAFKLFKHLVLLNSTQIDEFSNHYGINRKFIKISALSCYDYLRKYKIDEVEAKKSILYFGNIVSYKGLDYLFPAMKVVHESIPDVKLIVAGKGNYYFDIEEYKKLPYFDIQNRFIPDVELANMIQNSSLVVVPYVDATQSGVIMSAYAFNKPCVATNVGGLTEMVIDGKYGRICKAKDVNSLSNIITEMLRDDVMLDNYSQNIDHDYHGGDKSWHKIVLDMINFYKTI